jgi:hypothetical protein
MNTWDFITDDATNFLDIDLSTIDLSMALLDEPLFLPTPISMTMEDDWLEVIPVHQPAPEPPRFLSPHEWSDSEVNTPADLNPPFQLEEVQEQPLLEYAPITDVIDFENTALYHQSFAFQSVEFHGGPPTNAVDWWDSYENLDSDEIFKLISYFSFFFGSESLTEWQRQYLEDYSKVSHHVVCRFCSLPTGYWCDTVAKKL